MVDEVETGDVFRAAYLVSRGGRVVKAIVPLWPLRPCAASIPRRRGIEG